MMQMKSKERGLLVVLLVGILLAGGVFLYGGKPGVQQREQSDVVQLEQVKESSKPVGQVKVHVKGEVNNPGVYQLPADSRIVDAIEAAGGAKEQGDVNRLNLAAVVADGSEVIVPSVVEEQAASATVSGTQTGIDIQTKINLNTATVEQLDTLSGIGSTRAKAIVEYRERQGRFLTVDDLLNVPGFGVKMVDKIRDQVTVR
ncbi:MAG TPA: ComEA family DNA-binding protein [Bacilli bacterium]|nr:ComEA family DNA-binding protein [Bacilli bacterium]